MRSHALLSAAALPPPAPDAVGTGKEARGYKPARLRNMRLLWGMAIGLTAFLIGMGVMAAFSGGGSASMLAERTRLPGGEGPSVGGRQPAQLGALAGFRKQGKVIAGEVTLVDGQKLHLVFDAQAQTLIGFRVAHPDVHEANPKR